jgi:hypothetical protein
VKSSVNPSTFSNMRLRERIAAARTVRTQVRSTRAQNARLATCSHADQKQYTSDQRYCRHQDTGNRHSDDAGQAGQIAQEPT